MRKDVVVCMNMQVNYFSTKGTSYLGPNAKVVQKRIIEELRLLSADKFEVIHTRDIRSPGDPYFSHTTTQCVVGTLDVNMVEGLGSHKANPMIVTSSRPSAVWKTPLLSMIKKQDPEDIYLIGAETNSSILFTAADLRNLGYVVKVVEPLTVAKDEYLHNFAITAMADTLGVEIVRSL